jgi:glycosyltransferase involved in cell wall biosynthesis
MTMPRETTLLDVFPKKGSTSLVASSAPMGADSAARIAIVSLGSPSAVGGLAAYGRGLADQLMTNAGLCGVFLSCHHGPSQESSLTLPWPAENLPRAGVWHAFWRPLMRRLASRPRFHALLERVACQAVSPGELAKRLPSLDVIHFIGTGWDFLGFPMLAAARKLGARFTVWPAVHPHSWGDDRIDTRLYCQADAVFYQSADEKAHLIRRGVVDGKFAPCGLPPMCRSDGNGPAFRAMHALGARPVVLFIGRRDKGKGYPALLDAWKRVLKECPEAILVLTGPGGEGDQHLLKNLPSASVRDLGIANEVSKADALAACDIFCLPSAYESFGIVYVEAWSYGKPVICGTAPACRELVEDGETGLWSDGTPLLIADRLTTLLHQPGLRSRLGAAGQQLVQTQYTRTNMMEAHLQAWGMDALEPR